MKILTAAALLAGYTSRNHIGPQPGTVNIIAASAEELPEDTTLDTVQAMSVKGFATVAGPLQFIKAKENFYVAGEPVYIDDFVQVTSEDAKRLVAAGRADLASDDDVNAAQKASKGK